MDSRTLALRRKRRIRNTMSLVSSTACLQARANQVTVTKINLDAMNSTATVSWVHQLSNKNTSFGIRMVWLIVILAATVICLLHSADRIQHYLSNPSRVDIRHVKNNTIILPAVTICPASGAVPSFNYRLMEKRYPNVTFEKFWQWLGNGKISITEFWNLCKVDLTKVSVINYDDVEAPARKIKELISITEIITPVGICHQIKFNTDRKRFSKRILFTLEGWEESSWSRKVTLNEPADTPIDKYFYHRNGIYVSDRGETKYGARIVESIFRNISKDPCGTNEDVPNCLAHCFETVFLTRAIKKGCRLPFMQHFDNSPPCRTKKDVEGMIKATENATIEFDPEKCKCLKKCRKILYTSDYSYATGKKSDNIWWLEVNDPSGWITMLQEEAAYTGYETFADLGGCLGLWLGLCFLDVVELGTVYFSKVRSKFTYNRNKTNTNFLKGRRFRVVVVRDVDLKTDTIPAVGLPGFRNAVKRKSPLWIRILWLAVSMIALLACNYQCAERIALYFSDPFTFNVKYVSDTIVPFPSIMVCPNRSDGNKPALSEVLIQETLGKIHTYTEILQLLSAGRLATDDLWNMSSITFQYILDSKDIRSQNPEWISSVVPTILGNCLTFAPKATINFKGLRPVQKLRVRLNYEPTRKFLVCVYQRENLILVKYLLKLDCNELQPDHSEWMIETAFDIIQISSRDLHQTPCIESEQVAKCMAECIEKKIALKIPKGNCRIPFMATTAFDCNSTTGLMSVTNATLSTIDTLIAEDCNCFRACKEILYNKEYITISRIRGRDLLIVEMSVWNKDIMVMEEKSVYNIFSLFSDLGGSIGLFSGICVMTLLEVLDITFLKLFILVKSRLYLKKAKQRIRLQVNHRHIIMLEGSLSAVENKNWGNTVLDNVKSGAYSESQWNRILWFLIAVGLFCPCMHLCLERIHYFISDPTVTEIYYPQNTTIIFPVMLTCVPHKSLYGFAAAEGNFHDYWTMTLLQNTVMTYVNNKPISKDEIIISNISTTVGICWMITTKKPVKYIGYSTAIRMDIKNWYHIGSWMVAFSADKVPLLSYLTPKDCYFASWDFPTTHTYVTLKISEVIRRNTRNKPCENSITINTCLANCIERKIYDQPGVKCRLPFMQDSNVYHLCKTREENITVRNTTLSVIENFDKADCKCATECRTTMYSVDQIKFGFYGKAGLSFEVRIPENSFPVTKEGAAYSFIKLLSDLGGSLGLFFGFGLPQLLELLADAIDKLKTLLNISRFRSFFCR